MTYTWPAVGGGGPGGSGSDGQVGIGTDFTTAHINKTVENIDTISGMVTWKLKPTYRLPDNEFISGGYNRYHRRRPDSCRQIQLLFTITEAYLTN